MVSAMNSMAKLPLSVRELKERQRRWLLEQLKSKGHGSRAALAKHLTIRNDAITRMTNLQAGKEARDITFEELLGMAKFFGSAPPGLEDITKSFQNDSQNTRGDLVDDTVIKPVARHDSATTMSGGEQKVPEIIPGNALIGEVRDFPLYGSAHSGKGAMALSSEPVDYTVRPSTLLKVRDGYGVIYIGDDMSPKYESGYTLMVNPHVPPRLKDGCIFRRPPNEDGSVSFCVKEFVRETSDLWYVKQYSPQKSFALKKSEWPISHVIIGGVFR